MNNFIKTKSFILFLIIVISLPINKVMADEITIGNYQYIFGKGNNKIFTVEVNQDGAINFYGKHLKTDSGITYHTTGFNMALKKSNNKNPKSLDNRYYIERVFSNDIEVDKSDIYYDREKYIQDKYLLSSDNVIHGLLTLLKNEGYSNQQAYRELAKGVTVYFSNVFEVVYRNNMQRIGSDEYHSYTEIIKSIQTLKGVSWSPETQEILKYYYDNPIQIKLTPFTYNVLYVDAKEYAKKGKKAKTLLKGEEDQLVMFGQYAQADLLSSNKLTIKGTKYKYSRADYVYDNGQHNSANLPKLSNGIITAYHGNKSDATLYVLLDKAEELKEENPSVTPSITPVPSQTTPSVTENSISYFDTNSIGVIQTDTVKTAGYDAITGIPTTEYLYGSIQTAEYLLSIQYQVKTGQKTYPITVSKTYLLEKPSEESNQPSQSNSSTSNQVTSNQVNTKQTSSNQSNNNQTNSKQTNANLTDQAGTSSTRQTGSNAANSGELKTEAVTITQSGSVTRSYQYTEIVSIDYYKISNGTLSNKTLPSDMLIVTPSGYAIPDLNYYHYDGEDQHILAPQSIGGTITLESERVSQIPTEDLVSQGAASIGKIQVRNDKLSFDGKSILNSSWGDQTAPSIQTSAIRRPKRTNQQILYQGNQQIAKTLANGTYPSSGTITYQRVMSFQSNMPTTITYPISVNSVQIHTPVCCEAIVTQDNQTYLQLDNPDLSCIPLIIDENTITNDFTLHITNQGLHSSKTGYGNQDYSKYVARKNGKQRNEVRFPVDFYQDTGNDMDITNDVLIPSGQWTILESEQQRFYLPMWVEEGKYTVEVRSVANNGEDKTDKVQKFSNETVQNYVATNTFDVQVSGRLYGLTLYDIKDYPLWQDTFLSSNHLLLKRLLPEHQGKLIPSGVTKNKFDKKAVYDYRVGTMDSYGLPTKRLSKYTLPLVNGSHPQFANKGLISNGYFTSFLFHTNGNVMSERNARVEITPKFYYVDSNGKHREEVDLYYKGSVNGKKYSIIKVGSAIDTKNKKIYSVGSKNLSIPVEELEMTAAIQGLSMNQLKAKEQELFSYANISLSSTFRMFSNLAYAKKYHSASHKEKELATLKQTYYFQYGLPNGVRATKKGVDVASYAAEHGITYQEDFWKKDGYLIVNFDIKAYDKDGNLRYSYANKENYLNQGFCSMWILEGYQLRKTDYDKTEFNFLLGDVLFYDTDTTASDDYASSGIY